MFVGPVVAVVALTTAMSGLAAGPASASTVAYAPAVVIPAAVRQAGPASGTRMPMMRLLRKLPVRPEHARGYNRANYPHWITIRGGCDAREIVLIQESTTRVRTGAGCRVVRGTWRSKYDGVRTHNASTFDIDHFVPLAEVDRSGGYGWSTATRRAYANDTTYPKTLIAVSASANRSKGDGDPTSWMPARARCWYAATWIEVKYRWSLSVDRAEQVTLRRYSKTCHRTVTVPPRAKITRGGSGQGSGGGGGGSGGGAGLDPRFSTCTEAKAHGYGPYYQGRDREYAWYRDADHDGIVCE